MGKIPEKAVYRSAFLTTWHCILSTELTKKALLQTIFWGFCPLGSGFKDFFSDFWVNFNVFP